MKKIFVGLALAMMFTVSANAQFGKIKVDKKVVNAVSKGVQSFTLTDSEIKGYADQATKYEDEKNRVCKITDKDKKSKAYATRLQSIMKNVPADLKKQYNIDVKVYYVTDVNAYARPNGAIRVYSSLMDIMTDDQVLAVIGHEIGHVVNQDSKDAFATALRASALKELAGAVGGASVTALTNSQLGELSESLANAQFSQKQESQADEYGYAMLKQIGKDPSNMATSLGALLALQEKSGGTSDNSFKQLFSSHPDLKKRIDKLNKKK